MGIGVRGQVHELRDPTDADFVRAFDRISADTIIASDKDLHEYAPTDPVRFLIDLRHYSRGRAIVAYFAVGGSVVGFAFIEGLGKLVKQMFGAIAELNRKYPWLLPVGALSVAVLLAFPKTRQWIQHQLARAFNTSTEVLGDAADRAYTGLQPFVKRTE